MDSAHFAMIIMQHFSLVRVDESNTVSCVVKYTVFLKNGMLPHIS